MGADGRLFAMLVTKTDEFVNYRYIGAGRAVLLDSLPGAGVQRTQFFAPVI